MHIPSLLSKPMVYFFKTSPSTSTTIPLPPAAPLAQDGDLESGCPSRPSPTLSTTSTADGEDHDIELSPTLPPLPAPRLSERASAILREPSPDPDDDSKGSSDDHFDIASWGSPYPPSDSNLRRQSCSSSEASDDFPVHHLDIATPFLRPPPALHQRQPQPESKPGIRLEPPLEPHSTVSAAAAVLANRVRRQPLGLTEGWIRTHTAAAENAEPRHWLSEGSSSEDSYRGSDSGWFHDRDPLTPKRPLKAGTKPRSGSRTKPQHRDETRQHRLVSSKETIKAVDAANLQSDILAEMAIKEANSTMDDFLADTPKAQLSGDSLANGTSPKRIPLMTNGKVKLPVTPIKITDKPLPKEPPIIPRLKKKVPWKGKNIMILIPRDEDRGLPGQAPIPLTQADVNKMFASWRELGYNTDGFDLLVEGFPSTETGYPHSRVPWPSHEDLAQEHATGRYTVVLPDLNAWKNYVHELQEAKLRALGVSFGNDEPEPVVSLSSQPSRLPSAQYPPLPFSPPIPTSSASSNHAIPGLPFPPQFLAGGLLTSQSPAIPAGASPVPFGTVPGKYPRQSISFPTTHSPFQQSPHGWPAPPGGLQGMGLHDSPSLMNMGGVLSSQSPYGLDGMQHSGSPAFNMHQRHHSLQYLPQQLTRASPRLQDVREDEEEEENNNNNNQHMGKSSAQVPESAARNAESLQAEIDDAEYHLEEQLRNELEHEDYNPHAQVDSPHVHQVSNGFPPSEHFANEPANNLVLHHPRPHSRGHSLSKSFFRDQVQERIETASHQQFAPLNNIPEAQHADDVCEIETNPSNLGTPVNIDFAAAFHNKTLSTVSNPWQDAVSANSSARHSSHGSKQSSKFNVDAPVFKFNPTSSFTPGLFNVSNTNSINNNHNNNSNTNHAFQSAILHDAHGGVVESSPFASAQTPSSSKINAAAPAFAPSQSEFSFSSPAGLRFRPDAPTFTPLGTQTAATASPVGSGGKSASRHTDSIFSDVHIDAGDSPNRSIAMLRRSSTQPTQFGGLDRDEELNGHIEESRAKRAKSVALDGDEIPLFAERHLEMDTSDTVDEEDTIKETRSEHDYEGDHGQRADTSFSSAASSDHLDTQITSAASSETSPAAQTEQNWTTESLNEKRLLGEDSFKSSTPLLSHVDKPEAVPVEVAQQPLAVSTAGVSGPPVPARRKLTPKGLSSSRFASSPPPKSQELASPAFVNSSSRVVPGEDDIVESVEQEIGMTGDHRKAVDHEPTFEEIDAVMQHFENDPSMGINKSADTLEWTHSEDLQPSLQDGRSLTPRDYRNASTKVSAQVIPTIELEDPFLDPPSTFEVTRRRNNFDEDDLNSEMASDWENAFSEAEHSKLQTRAQFFDARVNELVGGLLASRLEPLAKTLLSIHHSLATKPQRASSSRRDMRSASADYQESDADDEDDELPPRRSMSPKRDRRLEQIRLVVAEALATQQRNQSVLNLSETETGVEESALLKTLVEIKEHLTTRPSTQETGSKAVAEPSTLDKLENEWAMKALDFEVRLGMEQHKLEKAVNERRAAEDTSAELERKLHAAESRVEAEIINRSVFDTRVADLEDRLRIQEDQTEEEFKSRHSAEDRLSEAQRQLRISSEEEIRLNEIVNEKEHRVKTLELSSRETALQLATLEAARSDWTRSQSEMANRIHNLEADLRTIRQDNSHWRAEAERTDEAARRIAGELGHTTAENRRLQRSLENVVSQLEENERLRESWRAKFLSLQEDMGKAAREVAEENARFIKRDQAMLARKEVLEARLHAEAKTRERLEVEMERLQDNERAGMRAVNECKRMEDVLTELRMENAKLQHNVSRYQREAELNSSKAHGETLLEDAHKSKIVEIEELKRKHRNEFEDMQTRLERQLNIAMEDGQRTEHHLLERLSLSTSKTEHLQDRILHLEDKLEITRQAAAAAAQAAKSAGVEPGPLAVTRTIPVLPEKISPQALRESIMVLQEQLQAREQRIEQLEQTVADLDPDAANKISKRDDEISWLRELLSVRHGDLQDIIKALSEEEVDRVAVKDAAIRLKANLQMEEQERERAMNGGSAISLPNIAQTLQTIRAATPRVAQTIGPIAAAWGNWRKGGSTPSFRGLTGVLASTAAGVTATTTPSRNRTSPAQQSGMLGGLLTPPASGPRQSSVLDERPQPTAFSSTGRRYIAKSASVERRTRRESNGSRQSDGRSASLTLLRRPDLREDPMTPPMMEQSVYDEDARSGDFDENDFFEED